jgi:hypothetical protein
MRSIHIDKKDRDPDFCWSDFYTPENAFSIIVGYALDLFEGDGFDESQRKHIETIIAALKAEDLDKLVKPLNEIFYDYNGEYFEIGESDREPAPEPVDLDDQLKKTRKKIAALNTEEIQYYE